MKMIGNYVPYLPVEDDSLGYRTAGFKPGEQKLDTDTYADM